MDISYQHVSSNDIYQAPISSPIAQQGTTTNGEHHPFHH